MVFQLEGIRDSNSSFGAVEIGAAVDSDEELLLIGWTGGEEETDFGL